MLSKKQRVEKVTSQYMGCIPLTTEDLRHIFHVCLKERARVPYGPLLFQDLQMLQQCALVLSTGRRSFEMQTISACSWTLEIDHVTGLRILRHKFHWMKNVGPGDFPATLAMVKDDRTHYNVVVLTLLLMER